MSNPRKCFFVFFLLTLLFISFELESFIIILKNGKKIEAEKYVDFQDKIKVIHKNVTLYIPKENIDYISTGSVKKKTDQTPLPTAISPIPEPTKTFIKNDTKIPEAKPDTEQNLKIEEMRIYPESEQDNTQTKKPVVKQKSREETQQDSKSVISEKGNEPEIIYMRGTDKEYFDNWEQEDFEPEAWEIYNETKDMEGNELEIAINRLIKALELDPHNDKIKILIAEKCGKLGWKCLKERNFIDAQKLFEQAYFFDLSQNPDYCFGNGIAKYNLQNFKFAESDFLEAQKRGLDSSELYIYLGNIAHELNKPDEAMKNWEKALSKNYKNQDAWSNILKRNRYIKPETDHFLIISLREGDNSIGLILSRLLETYYPKIMNDLGLNQVAKFEVYIDPEKDFPIDIYDPETASIDFKSYLYIPCKNITSYSWKLEKYLKSSLAYTSINKTANYNIPEWFASGFAQFESGNRISNNEVKFILDAMLNQDLIPITLLGGSFHGLTEKQSELALIQSLSLFEFIITKFGKKTIKTITKKLSENFTIEETVRETFGISYLELEELWKEFLIRNS